jgi:hypothetical protein
MVNNSSCINKVNNHLSSRIIDHKKRPRLCSLLGASICLIKLSSSFKCFFYDQWFEMRGDCSLCWYSWNCWPSLFKLSFNNCTRVIEIWKTKVVVYINGLGLWCLTSLSTILLGASICLIKLSSSFKCFSLKAFISFYSIKPVAWLYNMMLVFYAVYISFKHFDHKAFITVLFYQKPVTWRGYIWDLMYTA